MIDEGYYVSNPINTKYKEEIKVADLCFLFDLDESGKSNSDVGDEIDPRLAMRAKILLAAETRALASTSSNS